MNKINVVKYTKKIHGLDMYTYSYLKVIANDVLNEYSNQAIHLCHSKKEQKEFKKMVLKEIKKWRLK